MSPHPRIPWLNIFGILRELGRAAKVSWWARQILGKPRTTASDNGTEMRAWTFSNDTEAVTLNWMRNCVVETFNGSFRNEFLNEKLFSSLVQARTDITAWKETRNRNRLNSLLGKITPDEFAMKLAT